MNRWLDIGDRINFTVSLYYGGGLGDIVHRLYDSEYLRRLRSIKSAFPNLKIYLFVDTRRNIESAGAIFEANPYIDRIFACGQTFLNQDILIFANSILGKKKDDIGKFLPEIPNETVFQRVVNRVYELMAFPRLRTITMDDFFQQMGLRIEDFESDKPRIYLKPDEEKYGQDITNKLKSDGSKVVAVHFFSGQELKMISPQSAKDIIDRLVVKGYKVIIMGTGRESNPELHKGDTRDMVFALRGFIGHPRVTYLCDDTGIRHKSSVIANSDYMICDDSGLMHIAWLYKIRTVSLLSSDTFDRFNRQNGYYWAIAEGGPDTSYILFDRGKRLVDAEMVGQKIKELGC